MLWYTHGFVCNTVWIGDALLKYLFPFLLLPLAAMAQDALPASTRACIGLWKAQGESERMQHLQDLARGLEQQDRATALQKQVDDLTKERDTLKQQLAAVGDHHD